MMLITTEGVIIRIKVQDTALLGRITSGVKLINLSENVTVADVARVREDKSLINNDNLVDDIVEHPNTDAENDENNSDE